jgi:hypothetical protein
MKSKKLLVMVLVLLAGSIAFAQYTEGVDFVQYTGNDYNTYRSLNDWNPWPVSNPHPKGWTESHIISLNVQKGSTVYLTSYVSNFNLVGDSPIADLGDSTNPLGYDMNANRYGYVIADKSENGNVLIDQYGNYSVKPGSEIHWGTGETIEVTYYDPNGTGAHQTTLGYKLGTFEENTEIFFVMRPNGYDGTMVTSYDLVHDPAGEPEVRNESIFKSRHTGPDDLAANARVNFAFGDLHSATGASHEFVIGYVASVEPSPSGQPLPGVLTSCLVGLAATGLAARRRKHSRK